MQRKHASSGACSSAHLPSSAGDLFWFEYCAAGGGAANGTPSSLMASPAARREGGCFSFVVAEFVGRRVHLAYKLEGNEKRR